MAKPKEWFPFYAGHVLIATQHMSAEEFGAYWRLVCIAWIESDSCPSGQLPSMEADDLARMARLSPARWARVAPAVMRAINYYDGGDILRLTRSPDGETDSGVLAKARGRGKKRREAMKGALVVLTASAWEEILELFDYRCAYCLTPLEEPTQEHMQPLSRGGQHEADNVVPACQNCNSSKGTRTFLGFALEGWAR